MVTLDASPFLTLLAELGGYSKVRLAALLGGPASGARHVLSAWAVDPGKRRRVTAATLHGWVSTWNRATGQQGGPPPTSRVAVVLMDADHYEVFPESAILRGEPLLCAPPYSTPIATPEE